MLTIARRLCINDGLMRGRRERLLALHADPETTVDEVEGLIQARAVAETLARLPVRHRRLLMLRDLDGWSYGDIARFEGVTTDSVRSTLKRARAAFRRLYDDVTRVVLGGFGMVGRRLATWRTGAGSFEHWLAGCLSLFVGFGTPSAVTVPASPPTSMAQPATAADAATEEQGPPSTTASPVLVSRPDAPSPTTAGADGPVVADDEVVLDGPQPADGADYEFTVSPSYDRDGTVFAAGVRRDCLGGLGCALLFRSNDGGRTWRYLPAEGRGLGRILLPPSYPRDPRLFSVAPDPQWMLSVSDDGGRSFRRLAVVPGEGAISPLFSDGDPRILFGSSRPQSHPFAAEYHDGASSLRPARVPLPTGATPVSFAFAATYAVDRRMFVSTVDVEAPEVDAARLALSLGWSSAVYTCTDEHCEKAIDLGAGLGPARLTTPTQDHSLVLAWTSASLHRSLDGGRSFSPIPLPSQHRRAILLDLASGPGGRLFATMTRGDSPSARWLYVSEDHGTTWRELRQDESSVNNVSSLPDGRLMAGRPSGAGGGIYCSVDAGATWAAGCAG